MELRYRHTYEVRFDEVNLYGFVTPASALRYLQDIAVRHANIISQGEPGTWVARRTILEFLKPIQTRSALQIETFSLGFTKVKGLRGYEVRLLAEDGSFEPEPVLKGRTVWVYLDERGRPARVPPSYQKLGQLTGPPQEDPALPPDPVRAPYVTSLAVRFSHLDVLGHVNNAAYVELLDNVAWDILGTVGILPEGNSYPAPLSYDIEYHASAKAGETIEIQTWFEAEAAPGQDNRLKFERIQRISRDGTLIVRARSSWCWQGPELAKLERLFS
jgi:acyl-CoA thioester hydrolase